MLRPALIRAVVASLFLLAFVAYAAPWGPFSGIGRNGLLALGWWSGLVILGLGSVVILVHERPRRIEGVGVPASSLHAVATADPAAADADSPETKPLDPAR